MMGTFGRPDYLRLLQFAQQQKQQQQQQEVQPYPELQDARPLMEMMPMYPSHPEYQLMAERPSLGHLPISSRYSTADLHHMIDLMHPGDVHDLGHIVRQIMERRQGGLP